MDSCWSAGTADGEGAGHALLGVAGNGAQVIVGARCGGGEGQGRGMHPGGGGVAQEPQGRAANAGRSVIMGIHEDTSELAVTTRPWAVSGSALMTWMLTWAPAGTVM